MGRKDELSPMRTKETKMICRRMRRNLLENAFVGIDNQSDAANKRQSGENVSESNEPEGKFVQSEVAFLRTGIVNAVHPTATDEEPVE